MRADFRYLINSSKDTGPKGGWLGSTTGIISGSCVFSDRGIISDPGLIDRLTIEHKVNYFLYII